MMRMMIAASVAVALGSAAAAQTSIHSSNPAPKKSNDPNRKICERVLKTGSRLGAVTVCMTTQQWEAQRQDHRNDVERAQKNVGIKTEG